MAAQGQQQQQDGSSMDLMWGVIFAVAIVLVLWFFARGPILKVLFFIKLGEIYFLNFFMDLNNIKEIILRFYGDPTVLSLKEVQYIFTTVGKPMRIPIALILGGLSVVIFIKNPLLKFKTVFTMDKLRKIEKVNWPQISPVVNLDLVAEDIFKGPWAMAENPMEFAKKYKLLEELPQPIDPLLAKKGLIEVKVIEDRARIVFSKQIGPLFEDLNQLPIHTKALFAIFAARGAHDMDGANALLKTISQSSVSGKPDFTGAIPLLRKHYNAKAIAKILGTHAYVYTMMASMLEYARSNGVLATADFLWLKPLDRRLWYILNNTGRHTAFCEIAGPYSHWKSERALKRKVIRPMVDQAIKGLEDAVKMIIYTRDED